MKRFFMLIVLFSVCFICSAQYYYYDPVTAAENEETMRLNNIRFDVNAFIDNDEAYSHYVDYCQRDAKFAKSRKAWDIVGWTGLGISCASLIPIFKESNLSYDDPRSDSLDNLGVGLALGGLGILCVGYIGHYIENDKIKTNKKNMIYYLKTTNNGVGIVTIF